jgi:hypothetical protein
VLSIVISGVRRDVIGPKWPTPEKTGNRQLVTFEADVAIALDCAH